MPYDYNRHLHRIGNWRAIFWSPDAKECIVHEYLLYRWGVRGDAEVQAAIGKSVRIELTSARRSPLNLLSILDADLSNITEEEMAVLEKAWKLLPQTLQSLPLSDKEKAILIKVMSRKSPAGKKQEEKTIRENFKIVGVMQAPMKRDPPDEGFLSGPLRNADIIITSNVADAFFMQVPRREENGYLGVRLIVDRDENLESVTETVRQMGLNEFSMGLFIQQVRKNVLLIGFTMDFIAARGLHHRFSVRSASRTPCSPRSSNERARSAF